MKGLSLSGGSTKIAGIAGSALNICETHRYKPDYITGISAGAILALPLALGLYDEIRHIVQTLEPSDVFSVKPLSDSGAPTFRASARLICGKQSLGKQENLIDTIKGIVTEERFNQYKNNSKTPRIFIGAVDMRTGSRQYFDIKKGSYSDYLKAVDASSAIPVFVESVEMNDVETYAGKQLKKSFFMDGGMRDNIGSHWLMENYDITHHVSVYSRPQKFTLTESESWTPSNVPSMLTRSLEIVNAEKSKNDEFKENVLAKLKGVKTKQVFLDIVEGINYNMNHEELQRWFSEGDYQAQRVMNSKWTEPKDIELVMNGCLLDFKK